MPTKGLKNKEQLSPQAKKLLSYKKDCRNMVAESRSKSRFAIAKKRAGVHQAFRHAEKQILDQLDQVSDELAEDVQSKIEKVKRKRWRKISDSPLGEFISVQLKTRQKRGINTDSKESDLLKEAEKEDFRVWQLNRW